MIRGQLAADRDFVYYLDSRGQLWAFGDDLQWTKMGAPLPTEATAHDQMRDIAEGLLR